MLLRDLIAVPELGLRTLCGSDDALDRPVRWVYTTDLLDPRRYLSGGELVISGLMWRRTPEDSETFVAAIAAAGAAALAAGDALFHGVPDDLVEACRHHHVVLLSVPEEVSFSALTEQVVGQAMVEREARLAATLKRQRGLLSAVAEGQGLDDLAAQVSRETGLVCRVLTATGRHIVEGPGPLPSDDVDRVTRAFLIAERLPSQVGGRGLAAYSVFPVGPALGQRMTSWMVVVEGTWSSWQADVTEAIGQLAAVVALDRTRQDDALRVARTIADDAIAQVARGAGGQPETLVRLQQAGLDTSAPVAMAVGAFAGGPDLIEASRSVLDDAARHLGPSVVATLGVPGPDCRTVALLPAGDPAFADVLRSALRRLEPGVGRSRLVVGLSEPSEPTLLSGALEEARHACRLAELRPGPVSVVTGSEVTSYVLLLATVPDDVRHTFAIRVLGPLLDHDAKHGGELRPTLERFLDCSGSWSRTAKTLHLHVNTVRYRISKVEELTGRDLSSLEDRVDIFLALHSL